MVLFYWFSFFQNFQKFMLLINNLFNLLWAKILVYVSFCQMSSEFLWVVLEFFIEFFNLSVKGHVRVVDSFFSDFLGEKGHYIDVWPLFDLHNKIKDFVTLRWLNLKHHRLNGCKKFSNSVVDSGKCKFLCFESL